MRPFVVSTTQSINFIFVHVIIVSNLGVCVLGHARIELIYNNPVSPNGNGYVLDDAPGAHPPTRRCFSLSGLACGF